MFNYFIANIFNIFYSYSSRIKTYDMHVHPVVKQYMVSLLSVVDCVMGEGEMCWKQEVEGGKT